MEKQGIMMKGLFWGWLGIGHGCGMVHDNTCASLLITTEWSLKESHDLLIWDADAWQMMLLFFCSFIEHNL